MLVMQIGVFEDEEYDKVCFKSLLSSCVPSLIQNYSGEWRAAEGDWTARKWIP